MIDSIDDLRNHAINTMQRLARGEISVEEAAITGKLCDNVVSTIKVQLDYGKMVEHVPTIQFLENSTFPEGRLIESSPKLLTDET